MHRFVVLVLFSLIVLSAGCGEGTGRDTSTPMQTLIGHWRFPPETEEDGWKWPGWDYYYREDFTGLKLSEDGDITEFKWKVVTQNLKTRTIEYKYLDATLSDDDSLIYEVRFTEDFNSIYLNYPKGGQRRGHYVDAAQKP